MNGPTAIHGIRFEWIFKLLRVKYDRRYCRFCVNEWNWNTSSRSICRSHTMALEMARWESTSRCSFYCSAHSCRSLSHCRRPSHRVVNSGNLLDTDRSKHNKNKFSLWLLPAHFFCTRLRLLVFSCSSAMHHLVACKKIVKGNVHIGSFILWGKMQSLPLQKSRHISPRVVLKDIFPDDVVGIDR